MLKALVSMPNYRLASGSGGWRSFLYKWKKNFTRLESVMSLMQEKIHQIIRKSILFNICKKCSVHLVKRSLSFTHDTLFTLCTLFPFVPAQCTWKGLNLPAVGFWIGGRGRLRRCHREGRAPLLSECVMQQPLLWTPEEKTFGVDVWKCFLRFVLSVGGRLRRRWLVTFPPQKYLTSVCRAAPVWTLHKGVIFFFLSLCNWEFETLLLLMSSRLRMLILSYRPKLWSIRLFVWFFFF